MCNDLEYPKISTQTTTTTATVSLSQRTLTEGHWPFFFLPPKFQCRPPPRFYCHSRVYYNVIGDDPWKRFIFFLFSSRSSRRTVYINNPTKRTLKCRVYYICQPERKSETDFRGGGPVKRVVHASCKRRYYIYTYIYTHVYITSVCTVVTLSFLLILVCTWCYSRKPTEKKADAVVAGLLGHTQYTRLRENVYAYRVERKGV